MMSNTWGKALTLAVTIAFLIGITCNFAIKYPMEVIGTLAIAVILGGFSWLIYASKVAVEELEKMDKK